MAAPKTQTITLGDRSFEIPERLPLGIIREHTQAFAKLTSVETFDFQTVVGECSDAMLEILHAAVVRGGSDISYADFVAHVDDLDYTVGYAAIAVAITKLMKTRTADAGTAPGESGSSESATSPVSTG